MPRAKGTSPDVIYSRVKAAIKMLTDQKDMQLKSKRGKPKLQGRYTAKDIARASGCSERLVCNLVNGSSHWWERLREEGVRPNYWGLRLKAYGSLRHFKACALNEYQWRKKAKAIKPKEYVRLKRQLLQDCASLSDLNPSNVAYRRKLQLMYVKLKGWNAERACKAIKNKKKDK